MVRPTAAPVATTTTKAQTTTTRPLFDDDVVEPSAGKILLILSYESYQILSYTPIYTWIY